MDRGLDQNTLDLTISSIQEYTRSELPEETLLQLDSRDEFPEGTVRDMCGAGLGIQLLFIPEEYGGMGGGAFDVYRVCEVMAAVDLGVATGVLATFLGCDPIVFGGTEDQKKLWLGRIAEEGLLMAYCATEPEAGSDLSALRTMATPVLEDGLVTGYRLNGVKQWISNGGYADLYSVLALAPGGPSWFIVEKGRQGLGHGKPEDKHGIRASNTSSVIFEDVCVDPNHLVGPAEGQGLIQAQLVFGYTRLMVAAFGLGAGWAALDRAIPYSTERIQAGGPLSEKRGFTHKLIVPHAVRLEVSRAHIEETAERIDRGDGTLNTEGAIAKYLATEAGNLAADAAIQALGGYGYTREYMVEKIKRDVRITTIYEGTSEIMEMTIARDRWQEHLKTRGQYYDDQSELMKQLHSGRPDVGANAVALGLHGLAVLLEHARLQRLTRHQHLLFRLGELIAVVEGAASMVHRASRSAENRLNPKSARRFRPETLMAISRVNAREAAMKVIADGIRWFAGTGGDATRELRQRLPSEAVFQSQRGMVQDMDLIADTLYETS